MYWTEQEYTGAYVAKTTFGEVILTPEGEDCIRIQLYNEDANHQKTAEEIEFDLIKGITSEEHNGSNGRNGNATTLRLILPGCIGHFKRTEKTRLANELKLILSDLEKTLREEQ